MKLFSASLVLAAASVQQSSAFTFRTSGPRAETGLLATRTPFITGNWKLNPTTRDEAVELATGIADSVTSDSPGDVGIFVPFPFIEAVQQTVGDKIVVGAEVREVGILYLLGSRRRN